MSIQSEHLNDDPLPWLLELDLDNPGVRYFALRDVLGRPEDDPEVRQTGADIMRQGPYRPFWMLSMPTVIGSNRVGVILPVTGPRSGRSSSWLSWEPIPATRA